MFSYNSGDLSTDLNQVRLLINDTDSSNPEFQDEEINFFIDSESNVFGAASVACQALAVKYAQQVDKSVGDLKLSASQKFKHYSELADKYTSSAKTKGTPQVYAGGISVSDKNTQEVDTDRVAPSFERDQFDYVGDNLTTT